MKTTHVGSGGSGASLPVGGRAATSAPRAVDAAFLRAAEKFLELTAPEWLTAGSTAPQGSPDEYSGGPRKVSHSPAPVNLDVFEFLRVAGSEVLDLQARVLELLADRRRRGGPLPLPAHIEPDRTATGLPASRPTEAMVVEAFATLRRELGNVDDVLVLQAKQVADDIVLRARRLTGETRKVDRITGPRGRPVACPYCRRPSLFIDPADDDVALCANKSCLDPEGRRRRWSARAGEWAVFGARLTLPTSEP